MYSVQQYVTEVTKYFAERRKQQKTGNESDRKDKL